ncbi:MAG TPA: class I SAM-dependent methyltransferase [Kofleriaceae bacterium]|nr:class I SAM-dependent methyltransferase [Kofleriaceae bacterium]
MALSHASATFIAGGGRDADFHRSHELGLAPGDHIRLTDDRGADVGLGLADPENSKIRVLAVPSDGFTRIDGALLGWRVERALAFRRRLGLTGPDRAYRLLHGASDGVAGFTCDVMGKVAVIYAYAEAFRALGKQLAEAVIGFAKLDGAVVKVRVRGGASDVAQDTLGKVPETLVATEHDVPYEIHPLGGLNVGLFTDMREHRRGLARFAAERRVLNLFSYTGSLSVVTARAGAATVTSVDTSQGVQQWARGNFGRSGLDPDDRRWKFETGDASRFLARAARDKERYDLVLIDPPGASSAGGTSWALGRDYPELIAKAAAVIPQDGLLWIASNASEVGALSKLAHKGLRTVERHAAILETGGLPPEYPTPAVQSNDRYLQVCLLRLS